MLRRQVLFVLVIGLMFASIWWMYQKAADAAAIRDAVKRVPARIADLSVPMSAAFEVKFALPNNEAELKPFGLPVKTLGMHADGTRLIIVNQGVVDVTVKARGADGQPGRLTFVPILDLAVAPLAPRISRWHCVSDNLADVASMVPGCRFGQERAAMLAQHQVLLERAADALRPPPKPEGLASSGGTGSSLAEIALTPQEVEQALKSGRSLEKALAEKRQNFGQVSPPVPAQ